jgi:hypothetical protein
MSQPPNRHINNHPSQQQTNKPIFSSSSPSKTLNTNNPLVENQALINTKKGTPQQQLPKSKSNKKTNRKLPTTMSLTTPWARRFILSRPKDALLPIPREFLTDGFNLVQLAPIVEHVTDEDSVNDNINNYNQHSTLLGGRVTSTSASSSNPSLYKAALRLILEETSDSAPSTSTTSNSNQIKRTGTYTPSQIQKAAEVLYTLVHARYVSSPRGLDTIRRMFLRNYEVGTDEVFGKCPRMECAGTPLLPFGISNGYDIGHKDGICRKSMRYCCSCGEVSEV